MEQQTQNTEITVKDGENAANQMPEAHENVQNETLNEERSEALSEIKPAAGEPAPTSENPETSPENAPEALSIFNVQAQVQAFLATGSLEAVGILDETELEYSALSPLLFSLSDIAFLNSAPESAGELQPSVIEAPIFNPPQPQPPAPQPSPTPETPPAPAPAPELEVLHNVDIRLSNATSNQRYINDQDHYKIDAEVIGKNRKLFGEEMDIAGVPDDALVRYNFKTADSFRAVLKSNWNVVKNIDVTSEDLNTVVVKNFVHADIHLMGDADKTVKIVDAKRGFIETQGGDDRIIVKALTNGSGWSNSFEIDSGAGDDTITLKGDDGHTLAQIDAGSGDDIVKMRGDYRASDVDLGAGDDLFKSGKHEDTVRGGAGNDTIKGGKGHDVLYGGTVDLPEASTAATQLDFEFVKSQAGFKNAVGFYIVSQDGTIENTQLVFENLKALQVGDSERFEIAPDQEVKTFIIANGYNKNGQWNAFDLENGEFSFIYNHGEADERTANINDAADAVSLIFTQGGQDIVVKGNVFHDVTGLNRDGQDHTQESVNENQSELAFEDLYNLGDRDFTDAVFTLTQDDILTLNYESNVQDNDVLKGGKDNDVLIGGQGDDVIRGGQDIDIAVFMGSADEYVITKSGGTYTIRDTVDGRDGQDTLKGVEGLLFGVEDLYLDIQSHWSDGEIQNAFDVQSAEDIDLSDLLEVYNPVQNAIDDFVNDAQAGQAESIVVQNDIPALAILTAEDAFAENTNAVI